MEMVEKKFLIRGDGAVQGVGFRPKLVSEGKLNYGVDVFPRNTQRNVIEVVVKGDSDKIEDFYRGIADFRIKPEDVKEGSYGVGKLMDHNQNNPDFMEFTQALQLDQMSTFVDEARKLRRAMLEELPKRIAQALKE